MTWRIIIVNAWESYNRGLSFAAVGILLSAIWAAFSSSTNSLARLLPLASLFVLFIFFFVRAVWRFSVSRELKLAAQVRALEYIRRVALHINEDGDLDITRSLTLINKTKKAITVTIDEKLGFELDNQSQEWSPVMEMTKAPPGKDLREIYSYSYDHDQPLIPGYTGTIRTVCWGLQIRPFLEPGEELAIEYRIPRSPGTEKAAFQSTGGHLTLVSERAYSSVTHSVHAPPGYRFETFDLRAIAPDGRRDSAEEQWVRKQCMPAIDKSDPAFMRWEINSPILGYKYSTRYRLIKLGQGTSVR